MLIRLSRIEIQRPTMTHGAMEQRIKELGPVLIHPANIVRVNPAKSNHTLTEIIMVSLEAIYVLESIEYVAACVDEAYSK